MSHGQSRWLRNLGDDGPDLDYQLREAPQLGQRYGEPRNLSDATAVVGTVRRWADRAIVESAAATVVSAAQGQVLLPLSALIATSPGLHSVTFTVTAPASQRTYPLSPLQPEWLTIAAPLAGSVSANLPSPGAPLFVADGATGTVEANGQLVFAGASTTLTVPPGVSWFQLAWWGTQAPWATGTTPTLVQSGSTVDAGAGATMLASGGGLVVVTRVGTVLTAAATARATIWAYNGATYAPSVGARLIEQALGEPAPTGVLADDIVLQQNP